MLNRMYVLCDQTNVTLYIMLILHYITLHYIALHYITSQMPVVNPNRLPQCSRWRWMFDARWRFQNGCRNCWDWQEGAAKIKGNFKTSKGRNRCKYHIVLCRMFLWSKGTRKWFLKRLAFEEQMPFLNHCFVPFSIDQRQCGYYRSAIRN